MYNIIFLLAFFLNVSLLGMDKPSLSASAAAGAGTALQAASPSYDVKAQGEKAEKKPQPKFSEMPSPSVFFEMISSDDIESFNTIVLSAEYRGIDKARLCLEAFMASRDHGAVKIFGRLVETGFKPSQDDYARLNRARTTGLPQFPCQSDALKETLSAIMPLSLPSMQAYFKLSTIPSFGLAWEKCGTNADKIAVFEEALKAISREKNKAMPLSQFDFVNLIKQEACLKTLLEEQSFLDYIKQDLLDLF